MPSAKYCMSLFGSRALSSDFTFCRRRYEAAEKEFVAAKLELFRSQEQKELLSEHLCAIIRETELRKSRKLSQLCQALGVSDITQ